MIRPWTDDLIDFLNTLVALDPAAIGALIEQRVPCNDALAGHPTVQVGPFAGVVSVGVLGLLNGFCGTNPVGDRKGWGPVAAIFDDHGRLTGFCRSDAPPSPERRS